MSEFTVRPAREDELPAIGELTVGVYRSDGFLNHEKETDYGRQLADAAARFHNAELVVAVDADDRLLGSVTIAPPGSPWQELGVPDAMEFRMLVVSPAARGKGVGEALTRRVLDRAAESGLRTVVLSSNKLMTTAHRLYERLGFHRTPESDWEPVPGLLLITYRQDLPAAEREQANSAPERPVTLEQDGDPRGIGRAVQLGE